MFNVQLLIISKSKIGKIDIRPMFKLKEFVASYSLLYQIVAKRQLSLIKIEIDDTQIRMLPVYEMLNLEEVILFGSSI